MYKQNPYQQQPQYRYASPPPRQPHRLLITLGLIILSIAILFAGYLIGQRAPSFGVELSDEPVNVENQQQAQQSSEDVITGLDEITQDLTDLEDVVK